MQPELKQSMNRPVTKSWTLYHHRRLGIIELSFRGSVTAEEMLGSSAARVELGQKESVSDFLLDGSECTAGRATAETVYDIVTREYPTLRVDPNSRFAFIPPTASEAVWLGSFFESLCKAHGLTIRRFHDRDSAIEWLTSGGSKPADSPDEG